MFISALNLVENKKIISWLGAFISSICHQYRFKGFTDFANINK